MGIIDKASYKFTCPQCGITETATILDKGNRYSGSDWQSGPSLAHFNISWKRDEYSEPQIESVSCKECRIKPKIEFGHSQ